jgi:hypothetical protein
MCCRFMDLCVSLRGRRQNASAVLLTLEFYSPILQRFGELLLPFLF